MGVEILDELEQGSDAWFRARLGIPTASEFHTVIAKGKTAGAVSVTRRDYLYQLAGEIVTDEPTESYSNGFMDRGKVMEAEARDMYAFQRDIEPRQVGFIRNGRKGCSPDSLIGKDGGLEIKTKLPKILIDCMFRDPNDAPPAHVAQCQGFLWVAEREWIDLAIYYAKMPLVTFRIGRDNGYIARLSGEVDRFNDELDLIVERIRRYGQPEAKAA